MVGEAIVTREIKVCKRCGRIKENVENIQAIGMKNLIYDSFRHGLCLYCGNYGILSEEICITCEKHVQQKVGDIISKRKNEKLKEKKVDKFKKYKFVSRAV